MKFFFFLVVSLLNILSIDTHTVYFEGQDPKNVQPGNTTYHISKDKPGIVLTNFGNENFQFISDTNDAGIFIAISHQEDIDAENVADVARKCKIYSLPDHKFQTSLQEILDAFPGKTFKNFDSDISLECSQMTDSDYMIVVQSNKNVDPFSYWIEPSRIKPTDFYQDSVTVVTVVNLQPSKPYIRSLRKLGGNGGKATTVSDSTPQKLPSWNITESSVNSVVPTKNYLFTTFFISSNITLEVVPHLEVCSGNRTITQADTTNGVFTFPAVTLNGAYLCSFKIIPPSNEYYTKITMNGFLTTSFYLSLYYKKELAHVFDVPGTNLLTGNYYFPNGGVLEFDSGSDGYADLGFTISFIKLPTAPVLTRKFDVSAYGNITSLSEAIFLFSVNDSTTNSLAILSANENPSDSRTIDSLDYCFLTVTDNADLVRYSLREFTVFKAPVLFKNAYFQCVKTPLFRGKVIITLCSNSEWQNVCQMIASLGDYLDQVTFPQNPNCNGYNYLVQVRDDDRTSSTVIKIDSTPESEVLATRGVITGTYIGSVSKKTVPFTSNYNYVSYLAPTSSKVTLYWDPSRGVVATTAKPKTTASDLETTTKASFAYSSLLPTLVLIILVQ